MSDGDGNGRVTMAILGTKLDTVIDQLKELTDCVEQDHDKIVGYGQLLEDRGRRIAILEQQQTARTWETRGIEMLLAVATALGFIKGS